MFVNSARVYDPKHDRSDPQTRAEKSVTLTLRREGGAGARKERTSLFFSNNPKIGRLPQVSSLFFLCNPVAKKKKKKGDKILLTLRDGELLVTVPLAKDFRAQSITARSVGVMLVKSQNAMPSRSRGVLAVSRVLLVLCYPHAFRTILVQYLRYCNRY